MFFEKKVLWKAKVPWIWILYSASSIMFCLQIYIPQSHLISPIVVVEYRCRGDKQEDCLNNSDCQIPGKSKRQNRKIIFTSKTDMPSHVTKREPPASPISQSILYKLCRLSAKTRCWQAETKELLQNEWTPILTTWDRQYCLSCPCKLLLSHQSNRSGYSICSAPLWGYCMIYQDHHKMSKKL